MRRATVCWRGRGAAARQLEASPGTPRGSSERTLPLNGLEALILELPRLSHALRQRCDSALEAPRRRYPARTRLGAETP